MRVFLNTDAQLSPLGTLSTAELCDQARDLICHLLLAQLLSCLDGRRHWQRILKTNLCEKDKTFAQHRWQSFALCDDRFEDGCSVSALQDLFPFSILQAGLPFCPRGLGLAYAQATRLVQSYLGFDAVDGFLERFTRLIDNICASQ
jgi:hypothetical protein